MQCLLPSVVIQSQRRELTFGIPFLHTVTNNGRPQETSNCPYYALSKNYAHMAGESTDIVKTGNYTTNKQSVSP